MFSEGLILLSMTLWVSGLTTERLFLGRALFTSAALGQRSKDLELQA